MNNSKANANTKLEHPLPYKFY